MKKFSVCFWVRIRLNPDDLYAGEPARFSRICRFQGTKKRAVHPRTARMQRRKNGCTKRRIRLCRLQDPAQDARRVCESILLLRIFGHRPEHHGASPPFLEPVPAQSSGKTRRLRRDFLQYRRKKPRCQVKSRMPFCRTGKMCGLFPGKTGIVKKYTKKTCNSMRKRLPCAIIAL